MTRRTPVVAVIDDDPAMGRAIARMIETAGMAAVVYASAERMLEDTPRILDCAIVDVHMPGMGGVELRERLPDATPVIFMSASEDAVEQVQASRGAPCAFLAKPFPGQALLDTLKRLVG